MFSYFLFEINPAKLIRMRAEQYKLYNDGNKNAKEGNIPVPLLKDYPYTIGANMITFKGTRKPWLYIIYTPEPHVCVLTGPVAYGTNVLRIELNNVQKSFDKMAYLIAKTLTTDPQISIQNAIIEKKMFTKKAPPPTPTIEEIKNLITPIGIYHNPEILYFIDKPPTLKNVSQLFTAKIVCGGLEFMVRDIKIRLYSRNMIMWIDQRHIQCSGKNLVYGDISMPISQISKIIPWIKPHNTTAGIATWLINAYATQLYDVLLPLPLPIKKEIAYHYPTADFEIKGTKLTYHLST
jgi:hypothetical protein